MANNLIANIFIVYQDAEIPHIKYSISRMIPVAFEMVLSVTGTTGLSPNGKVTDFDSVICGFESR